MAALSPEEAIITLLEADSAVTNKVSTRIYPEYGPQNPVFPFIVYTRILANHEHHMTAASGLVFPRIELVMFGERYMQVVNLATAVREALDGYRGTVTVGADSLVIALCHLDNDQSAALEPSDGREMPIRSITHDYLVAHAESIPTF